MRRFRTSHWLLLMVAIIGCSDPPGISGSNRLIVEIIVSGILNPVYVTCPPADPSRLVVVQQNGIVRLLNDGVLREEPFLDIRTLVSDVSDQGRGLLSLAFDPQFDHTRHLFVSYTDRNEDSQIDRFTVDMNGDRVDPASRTSVISIDQPIGDHNGGHILFGPDGHLYVALGDGGSGETRGNAQDVTSLVGSILRLDVGTLPYTIPANNPFHQQPPARPEIWAFGLRNPWRWSFDDETGDAYIADVGEHDWEEINVVPWQDGGGYNFGWSIVEGAHCFKDPACSNTGLVMPTVEYSHDEGCGVIGGFVYRGESIPELRGHYLYADFCQSGVRSFQLVDNQVTAARDWTIGSDGEVVNVVSFGQDAAGEVYLVTLNGTVARIVRIE